MKKLTLLAVICLAAWFAFSVYESSDRGPVSFMELDSNRDGRISRQEVQRFDEVQRIFDRADTNEDGWLDVPELAKAQAAANPSRKPDQAQQSPGF